MWVKSRSGNEEAFQVDFTDEMNFDQLKEVITLPVGAIQSIHSENRDENTNK